MEGLPNFRGIIADRHSCCRKGHAARGSRHLRHTDNDVEPPQGAPMEVIVILKSK